MGGSLRHLAQVERRSLSQARNRSLHSPRIRKSCRRQGRAPETPQVGYPREIVGRLIRGIERAAGPRELGQCAGVAGVISGAWQVSVLAAFAYTVFFSNWRSGKYSSCFRWPSSLPVHGADSVVFPRGRLWVMSQRENFLKKFWISAN